MNESDIKRLLAENPVAGEFTPYCLLSKRADALTVMFAADADYTKRLGDRITVSVSMKTDQVIGCRLECISSLLADLQNYVMIDGDSIPLQLIFFAYSGGGVNEEIRQALITLAKLAARQKMVLNF
jgi:hypothetical protein